MRCRFPLDMGYCDDGVTTTFSKKLFSKELIPWQVPCGKCLECRLEYARQWAVRCVHEAQMHDDNSFITLTYNDENVGDGRLRYEDFQLFMKRLRRSLHEERVSVFVTGEYGDLRKRPHWHALLFGWRPEDLVFKYSNERGDRVYSSERLSHLWTSGISEVGSVTFESAGYCARYAAKKLVHGRDADHDFQPISKKSSKYAIGKKWLEKYWRDVFHHGRIVLPNGDMCSIPRYYEKWFKENHFSEWLCYVREVKYPMIAKQIMLRDLDTKAYYENVDERSVGKEWPLTSKEIQSVILETNFNLLQSYLKL